jgi:hypothetical protein
MFKIFLFTNLFYTLWNFINLYITQAEPQACSPPFFLSLRVLTIYLIFYAITLCFIMFICPFVGPLIWTNTILNNFLSQYVADHQDADEKLQCFQLPYIPCRMVSGNEIKLCLKYFCLPIYFIHFEISLTSSMHLLPLFFVAACIYNLFDILCNHLMFYYVYMSLRGPFNLDQ